MTALKTKSAVSTSRPTVLAGWTCRAVGSVSAAHARTWPPPPVTLDHLGGDRVAWNVVASCWDTFTGENSRRGGHLDEADRYGPDAEFFDTAHDLMHDRVAA